MTLKTSRNKTYDVIYVDGPTRLGGGNVMLRMADTRPLLAIGAEFDGLAWFERDDEAQGGKRWEGYTQLAAIRRLSDTDVLIELAKP